MTFSELIVTRKLIPSDVKQFIKTLLYLSADPEILEGVVSIFKELMIADENVLAEKVINKLMEIVSKTLVKDDIFLLLTELDVHDFV